MKFAQLNEYVQTLATIGAIAGLLLVAFEIRQSSRIALAESYRDSAVNIVNLNLTGMESGISSPLIKAKLDPAALTLEEKHEIDFWLHATVWTIRNEYSQVEALVIDVEEERRALDAFIAGLATRIFSSAWTRAWFYEREPIIEPAMAMVIRDALESTPLSSRFEGLDRIDARAKAMK